MKDAVRRGALVGFAGGSMLALGLLVRAMFLSPPGGEGERLMWFLTYAAILGAPVSLVVAPICFMLASSPALYVLAYALLALSVPGNWAFWGAGVGFIVNRIQRKTSHSAPERPSE